MCLSDGESVSVVSSVGMSVSVSLIIYLSKDERDSVYLVVAEDGGRGCKRRWR